MMKTTVTFDRIEIEHLIREKLMASKLLNFANEPERLDFNFGEHLPMQQSIVCTVEIQRLK